MNKYDARNGAYSHARSVNMLKQNALAGGRSIYLNGSKRSLNRIEGIFEHDLFSKS